MNAPVSEFQPSSVAASSSLAKVDRITNELRRGGSVVIQSGNVRRWLTAAETIDESSLSTFTNLCGSKPTLVVTGQRANRLGFTVEPHNTTYKLTPTQAINAEAIREVADPTVRPIEGATKLPPHQIWSTSESDAVDGSAIVLLKHAGLLPTAVVAPVIGPIPNDVLHIEDADVREGIQQQARSLRIVSQTLVPLEDAEKARVVAFRPSDGGIEHLAIIIGEPDLTQPVLIRLHSECFTGDLLGSLRCDCGPQLRGAIALMAGTGSGILLYLAQEGRGIGLVNKLRAYQLQDSGLDTVDANLDLGFEEDERDYLPAVQMLKQLNVRQVRVLTNNPRKVDALTRLGVNIVERVAHVFPANRHNRGYLFTKGTRGGHLFNPNDFENND